MTEEVTENNNSEAAANQQPAQFVLKKLYIKDLSFEIPGAPEIFQGEYKPEVKLDMNSRSRAVAENEYEVDLTISLTATQDETTIFVVEVQQAGIFAISGIDEEIRLRHALSAYCPNILFPYVRETVSGLVAKGGFPPLLLAPVNFDQLFAAQLQQDQAKAAEETNNQTEQ
jgi:preprotein translocase subunit SecB